MDWGNNNGQFRLRHVAGETTSPTRIYPFHIEPAAAIAFIIIIVVVVVVVSSVLPTATAKPPSLLIHAVAMAMQLIYPDLTFFRT